LLRVAADSLLLLKINTMIIVSEKKCRQIVDALSDTENNTGTKTTMTALLVFWH